MVTAMAATWLVAVNLETVGDMVSELRRNQATATVWVPTQSARMHGDIDDECV